MLIERLTFRAQDALERASRHAIKNGHQRVASVHLLHGLASAEGSPARTWVESSGGNWAGILVKIDTMLLASPKAAADAPDTPISRGLERVFVVAEESATNLNQQYINLNHLVIGLAEDEGIRDALTECSVDLEKLALILKTVPQGGYRSGEGALGEYEYLDKYAEDLSSKARAGDLDPVIGRDKEIQQALEVLSRRSKNNPIIIGEPGVGKTAIVEGLALRIAEGSVPNDLKETSVLALDLGQLIAGARFRGEFEERLTRIMKETAAAGNVVLFIDEIHMIVGAGGSEGTMDAANLLKPALSRGEIRLMGATTQEEYRKYIEKDSALVRRFQTVDVAEPTEEATLLILRGIKDKYESHHGVQFLDEALLAAVQLSKRYINDRFLPDKAIDLIDQSAATMRIALAAKPEAVSDLERSILEFEIERHALVREVSDKSKQRLAELEVLIGEQKLECQKLTTEWETNREAVAKVKRAKDILREAQAEMEACIAAEDFARVAELQHKVIPDNEKLLADFADADVADDATPAGLVTKHNVAVAVSRMTGIPAARMVDSERERLLELENHLRGRVVGQDEVLTVVAKAVRRARAGVQPTNKPLGSFLMTGPTGVGKTELAKALAEFLFDDEQALVRIDMSEFMEKHAIARLVGAPPGYIGYDEGGLLTNKVLRRPYSVILFDEVEKAHPDVFNLFLQLLDDGRLTDSSGRTVSFANTLILMTSNLGAENIMPTETPEEVMAMKSGIMEAVRGFFRPELINRLDDVLVFNQLVPEIMGSIVDIQLGRLKRLVSTQEIDLQVEPAAVEALAEKGFSPAYGARPLQRVIQSQLQDPLAELIINQTVTEGSQVTVDAIDGVIELRTSAPEAAAEP